MLLLLMLMMMMTMLMMINAAAADDDDILVAFSMTVLSLSLSLCMCVAIAACCCRYNPLEFDGWMQRHWTLPFVGERFSLVWFTPLGIAEEDLWWWKGRDIDR